jgi:hypothetical protein
MRHRLQDDRPEVSPDFTLDCANHTTYDPVPGATSTSIVKARLARLTMARDRLGEGSPPALGDVTARLPRLNAIRPEAIFQASAPFHSLELT